MPRASTCRVVLARVLVAHTHTHTHTHTTNTTAAAAAAATTTITAAANNNNTDHHQTCDVCAEGRFTPAAGSASCRDCDSGKVPNAAHTDCDSCVKLSQYGEGYSSLQGTSNCTVCMNQYYRYSKIF